MLDYYKLFQSCHKHSYKLLHSLRHLFDFVKIDLMNNLV